MKRIYLYPNINLGNKGFVNPYIKNLLDALSVHYEVVNKESPVNRGIFDILKYLRRLDILYLNWIEDLPDKRGGILQTIFFLFLVSYLKLSRKIIIWTLHNKSSHSNNWKQTKALLFNVLFKYSDLVITHAKDGLAYIPPKKAKLFFYHPVSSLSQFSDLPPKKVYDIIIWGSIVKYKGIDTFLKYLESNNLIKNYRILIAGRIIGLDLKEYLYSVNREHPNVELKDSFIEVKELNLLMAKSKVVLFCYHSDTVLSSGALMDSLTAKQIILGPEVGAFRDLREEGLIYTFQTYDDLILTVNQILNDDENSYQVSTERIDNFIDANSWEVFSYSIVEAINNLEPNS